MDKLIFSMPSVVIEKYIQEHFDEVSLADFLELINKNINIPVKLFNSNLKLLKNREILEYIFSSYEEIPSFIVTEIMNNKTPITYDDVKKYASIKNNVRLLYYAFFQDPRIVLLFPQEYLTYEVARTAANKGVFATEEDIIANPALKDIAPIIENSIKNDPKIIRLITVFCGIQLNDNLIVEALNKYNITEEDLLNNPALCGIYNIISKLPEYHFYSEFLTDDEKLDEIERLLKEQDYENLAKLPFFKEQFNAKATGKNIKWIAELLSKPKIEDKQILQDKFYKTFDYMVDGIVENRYKKNKFKFIYSDVVDISKDLKNAFFLAKEKADDEPLNLFANKISEFVNISSNNKFLVSADYLLTRINSIYNDFLLNDSSILGNDVTVFYNEILNMHRNSYCSLEKKKVLSEAKTKFPLTDKKKESIYNGKKLIKITYYIATHKFEKLGINQNYIIEQLESVELEISHNKDLAKIYGPISKEIFSYFKTLFLNSGQLDHQTISNMLGTTNSEIVNYIFKKYEQIKVSLLDKITLSLEDRIINEEQINKLDINTFNFDLSANELYTRNVAKILLGITDEKIEAIKEKYLGIEGILDIIQFIDIIPEFDYEMVIKVLANYTKIKEKIITNNYDAHDDLTVIAKFDDVIRLANGYESMNNLYEIVLGKEVVEKIGVADVKDYFDFYLNMLKRLNCSIPKVSGEYDGKIYESGNFTDVERLIIGKRNLSCIDLFNSAGHDTFVECLTGLNGDVIIIRDKNNKEFYARALIFRVGNVVQLACVYDKDGQVIEYPDEFFKQISDQIIKQAVLAGDNIDYVFVTKDAIKDSNFELYDNIFFETMFPHADLYKYSYLIGKNPAVENQKVEENLDFNCSIKNVYLKNRKPISYEASEEVLTALKALKSSLDNSEEAKNNFEPFYRNEFIKVISGEDWYVALKENGEIEEAILPSNDPRAMVEYTDAMSEIKALKDSITNIKSLKN